MADNEASRVLIVHNDPREASALQSLIEKGARFFVLSTWSGLEAIDLLRAARFDALLIDSYVADLYVGELIERASRVPHAPHIFVVKGGPVSADLSPYTSRGLCSVLDRYQPQTLLQALTGCTVFRKSDHQKAQYDSPKLS